MLENTVVCPAPLKVARGKRKQRYLNMQAIAQLGGIREREQPVCQPPQQHCDLPRGLRHGRLRVEG